MTKVLLVEDDPLILRLYSKTLQLEDYEVETAENGKQALEKLNSFTPDIILLDIMMPEMNGVQFLQKITAGTESGKIPVIVLTNVADPEVKTEAVDAGASLVLVKSQIEPDEVISSIKQVLNKEILQVESLENYETPPEQPS
jgi:CheY-like chemotaxis protein